MEVLTTGIGQAKGTQIVKEGIKQSFLTDDLTVYIEYLKNQQNNSWNWYEYTKEAGYKVSIKKSVA